MNCKAFRTTLRGYCEDELPPDGRRSIEAHAASCEACGRLFEMAKEITCREVAELYDYVANSLTDARRRIFERHFTICEECRNYLDSYRKTIGIAQRALVQDPEPSQRISEDMVQRLLRARKSGS